MQKEMRQQVAEMLACRSTPRKILRKREDELRWIGRSWERAYECARALLVETAAFAGADANKRSYKRVQRNMKDPNMKGRYTLPDWSTLRDLGMECVSFPTPGNKPQPLFDPAY